MRMFLASLSTSSVFRASTGLEFSDVDRKYAHQVLQERVSNVVISLAHVQSQNVNNTIKETVKRAVHNNFSLPQRFIPSSSGLRRHGVRPQATK